MRLINNNIAIFQEGSNKNLPIIFVHGFPYDHNMWSNQINELSSDYYCVAYDIRGLGESPSGDGQFTIEMFVDDIEFIIEDYNLNKPILCGLSMGGYISLRAIERMEDKFGGLILCDTKSEADNTEGKLKRAAGIKRINNEGVRAFVQDFIPNCFAEESIKKLGDKYKHILERSSFFDPTGVKGCLLAMAGRTDTTSYLSKIKIPTLILGGEKDSLTPPDVIKKIAGQINNSEFVVIPNAGHLTPVENPQAFNNAVINFLKKHFEK